MRKETITYETYNGVEITEDFYFNLNKAELMEMELSEDGGLKEHLERIIAAKDHKKLVAEFKALLLKSYGVKSPDGKQFIKNDEVVAAFQQSEAYSELFMKLSLDASAASAFVNDVTAAIKSIKPNPIPPNK